MEDLEVYQISVFGPIRRWKKPGNLADHDAQCVYCTEKAITFLGSVYPMLPFDIDIALAQTLYHCDRRRRNLPNFRIRHRTALH